MGRSKKTNLILLIKQRGDCVHQQSIKCSACLLCGKGICLLATNPQSAADLYHKRLQYAIQVFLSQGGTKAELVEILL